MFSTLNGENVANEITTNDAGVKGASRMILTNDGRLGIGINPKNHFDLLSYRLVVDGNIKCKKLRVDLQNWGDFVFDDGYQLMDLNSIEQFIAKNKHLPGMLQKPMKLTTSDRFKLTTFDRLKLTSVNRLKLTT
jgi:hypothetical protein